MTKHHLLCLTHKYSLVTRCILLARTTNLRYLSLDFKLKRFGPQTVIVLQISKLISLHWATVLVTCLIHEYTFFYKNECPSPYKIWFCSIVLASSTRHYNCFLIYFLSWQGQHITRQKLWYKWYVFTRFSYRNAFFFDSFQKLLTVYATI